jgi:hypothetical protein
VSRYAGEADYSAAVLDTFERFKQGAAKDYLIRYRVQPGMNHIAAQIGVPATATAVRNATLPPLCPGGPWLAAA